MSHYIKVQTKFRDAAALVAALREQYPNATVEQLEQPRAIDGWQGSKGAACSIIVRKGQGGTAPHYGDLGFALGADGSYAQHSDDSDQKRGSFEGLAQRYARTVTIKQAKLSGFTVTEQRAADGTITLNLSKWS